SQAVCAKYAKHFSFSVLKNIPLSLSVLLSIFSFFLPLQFLLHTMDFFHFLLYLHLSLFLVFPFNSYLEFLSFLYVFFFFFFFVLLFFFFFFLPLQFLLHTMDFFHVLLYLHLSLFLVFPDNA